MNTDSQNSDAQSGGFLGLIETLGTAYFSSRTAEAAAEAQAAASRTSLNSTGTPTVTATQSEQWVPGVDNKVLVYSGLAVVGLLAALAVIRAAK